MLTTARRLARLTYEDVAYGAAHGLMSSVGGSYLLPRAVRYLLYRAAGARVASPPGAGFTLAGSARLLEVGRDVYFNQGVFIEAVAPVTIGAGTAVGMQAMVLTSGHPLDESGRWQSERTGSPVVIGERCWIGARAVVLPGVTLGDGVVVAAGAVVTRDCLVPGVYAGVPARRIRDFPAPAAAPPHRTLVAVHDEPEGSESAAAPSPAGHVA